MGEGHYVPRVHVLGGGYSGLGDHTEAIQIDYDPSVISYAKLLDIFWAEHDPHSRSWTRQYMNAVFYMNEGQKRIAEESISEARKEYGDGMQTRALPMNRFYMAEDYHQKYLLTKSPNAMRALRPAYPDAASLAASTFVARLNAYIGGHLSFDELKSEVEMAGEPFGVATEALTALKGEKVALSCPKR